jgi:predicted amidohydrolase
MKAGYFQFKPEFCKPDVNISKIKSALKDKDFDLIVLPELANSGYFFSSFDEIKSASEEIPSGIFSSALRKISEEKDCAIVSGICERAGEKYYNSSVLLMPGKDIVVYRKVHLFDEEKKWFSESNTPFNIYPFTNHRVKDVKLGMMICFDWIFPESARTLALKGAQIICHPSNLVLPYCQDAMVTRALENRVFTITSNRTGIDTNIEGKQLSFTGMSEIVNPKGIILHRGTIENDEVIIVEIEPDEALDKTVTNHNDAFKDRREEFYK